MAVANYFNQSRATQGSMKPGYNQRAWLAPKSWFETIAEPPAPTGGVISKTIEDDHVFAAAPVGAGFIELYALPKSVEAPGDTSGEIGALNLLWTPKLFLAGDSAAAQIMMEQIMNDDHILLLEDLECPGSKVWQFGCDCSPANITKVTPTSGKRGEGNKGWGLEIEATCRFQYAGTIETMS